MSHRFPDALKRQIAPLRGLVEYHPATRDEEPPRSLRARGVQAAMSIDAMIRYKQARLAANGPDLGLDEI